MKHSRPSSPPSRNIRQRPLKHYLIQPISNWPGSFSYVVEDPERIYQRALSEVLVHNGFSHRTKPYLMMLFWVNYLMHGGQQLDLDAFTPDQINQLKALEAFTEQYWEQLTLLYYLDDQRDNLGQHNPDDRYQREINQILAVYPGYLEWTYNLTREIMLSQIQEIVNSNPRPILSFSEEVARAILDDQYISIHPDYPSTTPKIIELDGGDFTYQGFPEMPESTR